MYIHQIVHSSLFCFSKLTVLEIVVYNGLKGCKFKRRTSLSISTLPQCPCNFPLFLFLKNFSVATEIVSRIRSVSSTLAAVTIRRSVVFFLCSVRSLSLTITLSLSYSYSHPLSLSLSYSIVLSPSLFPVCLSRHIASLIFFMVPAFSPTCREAWWGRRNR